MTLDMWGWLLTFVIFAGFLTAAAYIAEHRQPEPRDMAHRAPVRQAHRL